MPSTDRVTLPSAPAAGDAPVQPAADATDASDPAAVADDLDDASYVHLLVRADGASVAAAGLLAERLPMFRCSPVPFDARRSQSDDADVRVAVGCRHSEHGLHVTGPDHALAVRRCLAGSESGNGDRPVLARAGAVCARLGGSGPIADQPAGATAKSATATDAGTDDPLPVATPTDAVAALQYSTLVHAPFSGDRAAAEQIAAAGDPETITSRAALATIRDAPDRAAGAVECLLAPQPTPDGPLATVEGLADVLDTVARTEPGAALSLALGGTVDAALDAWRSAGEQAHAVLRTASVTAASGVDRVTLSDPVDDPPVELLARLHHGVRATLPATIVAGADRLGVAVDGRLDAARGAIESAAESRLSVGTAGTTGRVRTPDSDPTTVVDPIADALAEVAA